MRLTFLEIKRALDRYRISALNQFIFCNARISLFLDAMIVHKFYLVIIHVSNHIYTICKRQVDYESLNQFTTSQNIYQFKFDFNQKAWITQIYIQSRSRLLLYPHFTSFQILCENFDY